LITPTRLYTFGLMAEFRRHGHNTERK